MASKVAPSPALDAESDPAPQGRMAPFWRILLGFALTALTLLSASLAIKAGRLWVDQAKTLAFCVARDGVDQRFAERLAKVAAAHSQRIRIVVTPSPDTVAAFERRACDLAVARADVKLPVSARSLAVLDKDIILLIAHRGKDPDTAAALRNRKMILASPGPANEALLRALLTAYGLPQADRRLIVPPNPAGVEAAFRAGPANLIFAVISQSKLLQGNLLHGLTQDNAVSFADIPEAAVLAKKLRGLGEETEEKGLFSASPLLPSDDLSTLSLEVRLVARGALRDATAAELTRLIFENKDDVALNGEFADAMAPPDTDKNAPLLAHPGAAQYVNDEEKSFIDSYGDYFYLGAPVAGAVGSFLIWLYGRLTRISPRSAGDLTEEVLQVAAQARNAATPAELEAADEKLDRILHEALRDLRDKSLSPEGLDVFRLAYEQTREWIRARRHLLMDRMKAGAEI